MRIVTLGDVMLDVLVASPGHLQSDDDTNAAITVAPGGQAANVATWAVALGAKATLIGPRGGTDAAAVVAARLAAAGVSYAGIDTGDVGTVVSIVAAGTRTMASDSGPQTWLGDVGHELLPADASWLHLSGYPLLRAADPAPMIALATAARAAGTRVSVDLASASMIAGYGPAKFAGAVADLGPDVVFANRAEWDLVAPYVVGNRVTVVVKDGAAGATVVRGDAETRYPAAAVEAVDVTGAGDAFAAGFLVGGVDLALEAAARCVAQLGAQPRPQG